jgi:hypothetical protein
MFAPGQNVICVDDKGFTLTYTQTPVAGCIYPVRRVRPDLDGKWQPVVGVLLHEVVNPTRRLTFPDGVRIDEPGFVATRFRPVRDTSIDVFRKLLEPQPEEVA